MKCPITGKKENLILRKITDKAGDEIGIVFIHESVITENMGIDVHWQNYKIMQQPTKKELEDVERKIENEFKGKGCL